jgi:hypothetical protein
MIKNTTHPEDTLPPPVSDATLSDKSLVARGLFAARYCEPYHKLVKELADRLAVLAAENEQLKENIKTEQLIAKYDAKTQRENELAIRAAYEAQQDAWQQSLALLKESRSSVVKEDRNNKPGEPNHET